MVGERNSPGGIFFWSWERGVCPPEDDSGAAPWGRRSPAAAIVESYPRAIAPTSRNLHGLVPCSRGRCGTLSAMTLPLQHPLGKVLGSRACTWRREPQGIADRP